jgi:SAM-dependent methyltransferase
MRPYGLDRPTLVDRLGEWLSLRAVRGVVRQFPAPDVLDVGCGYEAATLRDLSRSIRSGMGVDARVSDEAKGISNLRFLERSAEEALPALPSTSFDVVVMVSVLEHLWEPLEALAHAWRVLRPDGALAINVPSWLGKEALELSAFRLGLSTADSVDDHKRYYAGRELWPLLVRAGFRPSRIRIRHHKLGLNLFAVAHKDAAGSVVAQVLPSRSRGRSDRPS